MPKWELFRPLSLLAHVKAIRVRLHPGRQASEGCRQLGSMLRVGDVQKKFPGLQSSIEFLGYDAPSEIYIEFTNGKKYRLLADGYSLQELQMRLDREQYKLFVEHIKEHAADSTENDEA
ncbi:uncharacterized protein LOC34623693 [Cyclospora cayetanensis]|uniref:Uncharacterized protein LOC34623693 n=1 Tax=Cyclospora cayetanensis TaxID=88456 RepID=A0A6P5WEF3_9EIME|nr:uncharacterized protein LOC34623693 [Cyclospora cayetanensis]